MSSRSTTFVLIHGAWHGAWCWQKLRSLLTLAGHRVLAPDLPGLGQDRTPLAAITFTSYVERVIDLLDRTHEPVILVGHSLGGMTISQVAEERPEKIRWLAYLTAVLPRAGESASSILDAMEPDQALFSCVESDEKSMRLRLPESLPFFYHDCLPEDSRLAEKLLRPQALLPLTVPVTLSQRFAGVPRAYLGCSHDRVLTPTIQTQLYTRTPCEQVIWLPGGHSPFFAIPTQLAACLEDLALSDPSGVIPLAG